MPLFSPTPVATGIRLAEPTAAPAQSRPRKQFNTLMKKLDAERLRLAAWHQELPRLRTLFGQQFVPLAHEFDAKRKQMVLLFDRAHGQKGMGKRARERLEDLIGSLIMELLEHAPDEELERIYDKYDENPFADYPEGEEQALRSAMEAMFDVELDDTVDDSSPEAMFAALAEQLAQRARQEQQEQEREQARCAKGPGPAKTSARALREQAEALKLQQSVREIYRKLASDLHPDREPDPAERDRKTGLMQRVNVAYEKRDLLALLELQVEVAQIDQAGLDRLDDERIKQYNKILARQLRDLEDETAQLEYGLMQELRLRRYGRLTPKQALDAMGENIAAMRETVAGIARELQEFQDISTLKAWLKTYRIPEPDPYGDDDYWF
jgi:hypothetical protein